MPDPGRGNNWVQRRASRSDKATSHGQSGRPATVDPPRAHHRILAENRAQVVLQAQWADNTASHRGQTRQGRPGRHLAKEGGWAAMILPLGIQPAAIFGPLADLIRVGDVPLASHHLFDLFQLEEKDILGIEKTAIRGGFVACCLGPDSAASQQIAIGIQRLALQNRQTAQCF
jgi:hypothetical protein